MQTQLGSYFKWTKFHKSLWEEEPEDRLRTMISKQTKMMRKAAKFVEGYETNFRNYLRSFLVQNIFKNNRNYLLIKNLNQSFTEIFFQFLVKQIHIGMTDLDSAPNFNHLASALYYVTEFSPVTALKNLLDYNLLLLMLLHVDFQRVQEFFSDLFTATTGHIQLADNMTTLLQFYCKYTNFYTDCAKLMLYEGQEMDTFKLDINYKPKQLRGFTFPVDQEKSLFTNEKTKKLLDIDRMKVAMKQGKKFSAKRHMRKFVARQDRNIQEYKELQKVDRGKQLLIDKVEDIQLQKDIKIKRQLIQKRKQEALERQQSTRAGKKLAAIMPLEMPEDTIVEDTSLIKPVQPKQPAKQLKVPQKPRERRLSKQNQIGTMNMAKLLDLKDQSKPYYTTKKNYALTFVNESDISNIEKFDNLYPSLNQSVEPTEDDLEGADMQYSINRLIKSEALSMPIATFFQNVITDCVTNYDHNMDQKLLKIKPRNLSITFDTIFWSQNTSIFEYILKKVIIQSYGWGDSKSTLKIQGHIIENKCGPVKIGLLEILYWTSFNAVELASNLQEREEALDQLTDTTLSVVVIQLFEYPTNNIYQVNFMKFMQMAISKGSEDFLKRVFFRHGLLNRIHDFMNTHNIQSRKTPYDSFFCIIRIILNNLKLQLEKKTSQFKEFKVLMSKSIFWIRYNDPKDIFTQKLPKRVKKEVPDPKSKQISYENSENSLISVKSKKVPDLDLQNVEKFFNDYGSNQSPIVSKENVEPGLT